jgi:PAS domain S-box-containing protein
MNRILLVAASQESALNLSRLISRELKVELLQAGSGTEALEIASRTLLDLVVVDVHLPQIDGFDFCGRLHEQEVNRHVPVLLLTTPEGGSYPEVKALSIGPGEISTLPTPGSNLLAWIAILLKITAVQQRQSETMRDVSLDSAEIYRILLDHTTDAVLWLDVPEGIIRTAGGACEKLTGYPIELLTGKPFAELVREDEQDRLREIWDACLSKSGVVTADLTLVRRSGMQSRINLALFAQRSDSRDGVIARMQEIPESAETSSFSGVGYPVGDTAEFLRALAHEVRNPLTGISTNVQYMQMTFADSDTQKEIYKDILEAVARLDWMFREVVEYVRPAELRPVKAAPAQLVNEILAKYGDDVSSRRKIEWDVRLDASLPEISVDESRLHHVFDILLTHCLREAGESGKITIEGNAASDRVTLSLSYPGIGITPQQLPRIFHPITSLKSADPGLGLAYVKRVMDEHNAEFEVESRTEKGETRFNLHFPVQGTTNR